MRVVGVATLVLLMACGAEAQVAQREPVCQAVREGAELITRVHFPDGYSVEGPWHVTETVRTGSRSISAVLDHIVETRPLSGTRETTSLPTAIQMTFSGPTMDDVLAKAASVWCETVLQARPIPQVPHGADHPAPDKVM